MKNKLILKSVVPRLVATLTPVVPRLVRGIQKKYANVVNCFWIPRTSRGTTGLSIVTSCWTTALNLIILSLSLTSCAVGPDYHRPKTQVPYHFKEIKNKDWKIAKPTNISLNNKWWEMFHDPTLSALEERLNRCNQSVLTAYDNFKQAQALVDEARANFYPVLIGNFSLQRQKGTGSTSIISTSSSGTLPTGSTSTGIAATSNSKVVYNHSISFNASWQPDIWGLVRRQVEASAATAQADAALFGATRLSSQASLATFYFELRALDTDQQILDDTVRADKKILQLTINQYHSGVISAGDILQAKSQLEAAESLAINNGVNRAIYEHAIAVLLGIPASAFSLVYHPLHGQPPVVPLALPSYLLERRPDVAQAERTMASASAQIGVAVAAYFPTLTLTGNASFVNQGLGHWISMPEMGWAYGPQLSELIYDGGLRNATVRAAQYGYLSTVASYRQTVLAAFQNVEDNLATLRILTHEGVVQNQAAITAQKALKYVINEYKAGTVPFSSVLTSQLALYTAQKNAADIVGLRMTAAVGLVVALGGGWDRKKIDELKI